MFYKVFRIDNSFFLIHYKTKFTYLNDDVQQTFSKNGENIFDRNIFLFIFSYVVFIECDFCQGSLSSMYWEQIIIINGSSNESSFISAAKKIVHVHFYLAKNIF